MFSAVYLVCVLDQPCQFYVDPEPYPSMEVCSTEAKIIIQKNSDNIITGTIPDHTAEFQCITWEKA